MSDFNKTKSKAAEWLFNNEVRNEDSIHYFRWWVLTERNDVENSLRLSDKDAFQVFADLVQRGMLVPCHDEHGNDAFMINHGADDDWERANSPKFFMAKSIGLRAIDMVIGAVVGALIGAVVTKALGGE